MAKEIISAGTKLFMGEEGSKEQLTGLLSTPELSEGEPEKLEVTTLEDSSKRYINGLKDLGEGLEFEFNYESQADSSYYKLRTVEESKNTEKFTVEFPDGLSFSFEAYVSTKFSGASVGEQIKFTASLTPASAITMTAPSFS